MIDSFNSRTKDFSSFLVSNFLLVETICMHYLQYNLTN